MLKYFILAFLACGLSGCATLSTDQRTELDARAETNIQSMAACNPGLQKKLEECKGYLALDARLVKIPFIGWGGGKGVVVDSTTGHRTYVKVARMDVGGGGGIREFDVLIVLYDEKLLQKAQNGKWIYGLGAEASAGKASAEGSSGQLQTDRKYELFTRSERGASVTWTLHAIRFKPYRD
jgi:lipid-binding SYLF domain-containing protein